MQTIGYSLRDFFLFSPLASNFRTRNLPLLSSLFPFFSLQFFISEIFFARIFVEDLFYSLTNRFEFSESDVVSSIFFKYTIHLLLILLVLRM